MPPLRRLLRLASTLSLLLCLACLIAIPLSFFRALGIVRTHEQSSQIVRVVTGYVTINDQRGPGMPAFIKMTDSTPSSWLVDLSPTQGVTIYWQYALRPHYIRWDRIWPGGLRTVDHRVLFIPLWLLALIFSLPKTLPAVVRRLRRPPPAPGHCPTCGYDRRATPDRCPECGTVRPPVTPPAASAKTTPAPAPNTHTPSPPPAAPRPTA